MSERTQDEFSYVDDGGDGGGRMADRLQYALTISRFIILFLSRRALRIWIHANIILLLAQRKYSRRKRTTTNIVWFVRVK
jgi:hypothetical protein